MNTGPTPLQERIARALYENAEYYGPAPAQPPWDSRDSEERGEWMKIAAAALPIIAAEVQASKAEAILMDGFDMAVADRLADAGYTEYAEDEDGGVTWVSAPLGEVLHIVRICATEYETGDRA